MSTREERKRLKKEYSDLFARTSAALFKHDPMGINFEDNTDEYDPEAATILPRLRECHSAEDVRKIIHQEFCKWFGSTQAGPIELYTKASQDIWELWQSHVIG